MKLFKTSKGLLLLQIYICLFQVKATGQGIPQPLFPSEKSLASKVGCLWKPAKLCGSGGMVSQSGGSPTASTVCLWVSSASFRGPED